jgi:hypothetical protein
VAKENNWPADWLNEGAKGFVYGTSEPQSVVSFEGIEVLAPAPEQLLAMKLGAWRDELDIRDATALLHLLSGEREQIWHSIEPFIAPPGRLKARYAFEDLWEQTHDSV